MNKENISFSPWSLLSKFNQSISGTHVGVIYCKLQCIVFCSHPSAAIFDYIIGTLGSILDSKPSWESSKFQFTRCSHNVALSFASDHPPHLLLKHIWILFGVLSLVWTFNQIPSNGMCGGPPSASRISKNLNGVPTPVWTSYQKSPPSSQTSYQSSSTCISECCNPKWACSQMFSSRFNTSVLFFSPTHYTSCAGVIGAQYHF